MKTSRCPAVVTLGLMSVMNLGYPFGTDPKPELALGVAVLVLGPAGVVAVSGLARNTAWGIQAAVAVAGVNILGALIALLNDSEGAVIGLAVSSIALVSARSSSPSMTPEFLHVVTQHGAQQRSGSAESGHNTHRRCRCSSVRSKRLLRQRRRDRR